MSISTEILRIQGNVADAYTAANAKGATMPVTQNSDNLASTISTIQTGTTPTGTIQITTNGTHDVTNYATADIQVPTTAPALYREFQLDGTGKLVPNTTTTHIIDFTGVTDISRYALAYAYSGNTNISGTLDMSDLTILLSNSSDSALIYAFSGCTGLTSVDLSGLISTEGAYCCQYMFSGCTGLTSVDLSSLASISGSSSCATMFQSSTSLTSVNLSSLMVVSGGNGTSNMFSGCTSLGGIDLSSLTLISGQNGLSRMFIGCTNLTSVNISHLAKLSGSSALSNMFMNCTSLTELRFNGLPYTATNLNNMFNNMLTGCSGVTVHFPSDWATDMASWSSVTNGFGGTNTTVLWDLPAVTTLDLTYITNMNGGLSGFDSNSYFPNVTSVDLSSLVAVNASSGCSQMFSNCTGLTSVDLSSLTTISSSQGCYYMLRGCTGLTGSFDLSSLTTIGGSTSCYGMFQGCTGITSVDLSSLTTISGQQGCQYMFSGCTGLTGSFDLSSLTTIGGYSACQYMFEGCTSLTTLSFPALKTVINSQVFNNMLSGVTGCTVHFPSNLSNSGFSVGGTNTTVLYDLPATNTLTGADTVTYTRNPKYDTGTALAWKVGAYGTTNFTPAYYTSGLTDPTVGTTIYSDAACTISVTTVSSIA